MKLSGYQQWGGHYDDITSASKSSIRRFVITEKAPTRAFSWLRAATTAFTVGAFSVITNLRMELFEALDITDGLTLVQLHRGHVHLPCFSLK